MASRVRVACTQDGARITHGKDNQKRRDARLHSEPIKLLPKYLDDFVLRNLQLFGKCRDGSGVIALKFRN